MSTRRKVTWAFVLKHFVSYLLSCKICDFKKENMYQAFNLVGFKATN